MRLEQDRAMGHGPRPKIGDVGIFGLSQQSRIGGMIEFRRVLRARMRAIEDQRQALLAFAANAENARNGFGHAVPPSCRWQAVL